MFIRNSFYEYISCYPQQAKRVREVANLTERKNSHTPVYGVKEFVRLSVCLSVINFDPNYFRTDITECAKKIGYLWQNECSQKFIFFPSSTLAQNVNFTNFFSIPSFTLNKRPYQKKIPHLTVGAVFVSPLSPNFT